MSLDLDTSGNSYDDTTNTMTVGAIDYCLTSPNAISDTHTHTAHLIVQNVEDLVGWQARMNYDGGRMRPSTFNASPFMDNNTGQAVGFVNLPIDQATGFHRDVVSAADIPPGAAGPQTALIGAVYNGRQGLAISPDTPQKDTHDETAESYSTSGGGILASLTLQVLAGNQGQGSLFIDLDNHRPNDPGSALQIFTEAGMATYVLNSQLGDGYHGEGVDCAAPSMVDSDGDRWSDAAENTIGTDPLQACGADSWPPDINNDAFVDTADVSAVSDSFGHPVPPAPARHDIGYDEPDGGVDTGDIIGVTFLFGRRCS